MSADLDRDRLVKLCGLFSSEHDGERAAAAASADRMLRQAGLRWPDVIQPALPPPDHPDIDTIHGALRFCAAHPDALTPWEQDFVASLARQSRGRLSAKQAAVLERLVGKCRRHRQEAAA